MTKTHTGWVDGKTIELKGARYRELWTGRPRGRWAGSRTIAVPPHGARILQFFSKKGSGQS